MIDHLASQRKSKYRLTAHVSQMKILRGDKEFEDDEEIEKDSNEEDEPFRGFTESEIEQTVNRARNLLEDLYQEDSTVEETETKKTLNQANQKASSSDLH